MANELQSVTSFIYDRGVTERFPTVGVIGASQHARMLVAPATALGVRLRLFAQSSQDSGARICEHVIGDYKDLEALKKFAHGCDVITFEHGLISVSAIKGLESSGARVYPPSSTFLVSQLLPEEPNSFDCKISVMVARSPHGQATSWSPTEAIYEDGICTLTITPASSITSMIAEKAQQFALDIAQKVGVVGVMAVEMGIKSENIYINDVAMYPHDSGLWTIDGSKTSQYEQHLRAILDLPLGDPSMTNEFAVMGKILGGDKTDMYRPYLHLMARNPDLKFHQYKNEVRPGHTTGHVTRTGSDLRQLTIDVQHARDYMSGTIDE